MKGYVDYMNTRTVDSTLHEKIMQRVTQNPKPIFQRRLVVWYTMAAACAVVLLFGLWIIPGFFNDSGIDSSHSSANNTYDIYDASPIPTQLQPTLPPKFAGLPVVNHCLPQENPMASRMGVSSLLDIIDSPGRAVQFWTENPVQAFAFVRVIETTQEENRLISTIEVLKTVWSREHELPKTMTLTQHSGAIMCCTPYGELMREGGVFLLPLWYNDGSMQGWHDGWFNWTYHDVLFEIDNNGLVWSRSNLSAFNRFDGRHTSVLTNAILGIINGDENLGRNIAHTIFGWAADDGALAIITIASSESNLLFSTGQELWQNSYVVNIDQLLSTPTPFGLQRGSWFEQQQNWRNTWQISKKWWQDCEQNNEIFVVVTDFARSALQTNGQYLVFITPSYSNWHSPFTFFSESVAMINADGTITSIPQLEGSWNVFGEYDGYTIDRLTELAQLANTWHERYAE